MNLFKTIGRMFTLPANVRKQIDANPLKPVVQAVLKNELGAAITGAVDKSVTDPTLNGLLKQALGHAVESTGIFN